ncbi:hypothetical protein PIB30_021489 [Stylosanthes scabra]|uniref:Uncharacterized protein n=1 Tax=Stylosanthes scabra TaxID=79078 RepID=A0ABU6YAW0_9FABA|nr:hypothetical protein [Stylosanthes scabra]
MVKDDNTWNVTTEARGHKYSSHCSACHRLPCFLLVVSVVVPFIPVPASDCQCHHPPSPSAPSRRPPPKQRHRLVLRPKHRHHVVESSVAAIDVRRYSSLALRRPSSVHPPSLPSPLNAVQHRQEMEPQFDISSSGINGDDVALPNDSASVRSPEALPAAPAPRLPLPQRNTKKVAVRGRAKRCAVEEPLEDDTPKTATNAAEPCDGKRNLLDLDLGLGITLLKIQIAVPSILELSCKRIPKHVLDPSQKVLCFQQIEKEDGTGTGSSLFAVSFDVDECRQALCYMIIVDELPFAHVDECRQALLHMSFDLGCSRVTGIRLPDRTRTDPIILVQYPTSNRVQPDYTRPVIGSGASLLHSFELPLTAPPTGHSHRPTPRPTAHGPPRNPTFPPIPSRDVADTEGDTTPRLASSPRQLFIVSSRRQVSPLHAASASPRLRHVSTGLKLVAAPLLRFVVAPNLVEVVLIPPHAR